jgi:ATP-dependent Lon protease
LIVQGLARISLNRVLATKPYLRAEVSEVVDVLRESDALEIDALERNIRANFSQVVQLSPVLSEDLNALATNITDVTRLTDFVALEPRHNQHRPRARNFWRRRSCGCAWIG